MKKGARIGVESQVQVNTLSGMSGAAPDIRERGVFCLSKAKEVQTGFTHEVSAVRVIQYRFGIVVGEGIIEARLDDHRLVGEIGSEVNPDALRP
jgi:hypothetical protein